MNAAISELKTRARLGLNALKSGDDTLLRRARAAGGLRLPPAPPWQLRHAFALVAASVGFRSWEQARRVLGGLARPGDDMGSFWHAPACATLLNHWFAAYADAAECHRTKPGTTLLPYRRQFVVVRDEYLRELGLDEHGGPDLVAMYGSPLWSACCLARLRAPASSWPAP